MNCGPNDGEGELDAVSASAVEPHGSAEGFEASSGRDPFVDSLK